MSYLPGKQTLSLLPAMLRFVVRDGVRPRQALLIGSILGVGVLELVLILHTQGAPSGSQAGAFFVIGILVATAPLCRSWLDEDVRLGHGALWLQKPVSVAELYLARLLAAMTVGVVLAIVMVLATVPAVVFGAAALERLAALAVVAVPIPPMLIALGFLGTGLGVRNGALFAYLMFVLGFWLEAFVANLDGGAPAVFGLVEPLLPPARALLEAGDEVAQEGLLAGAVAMAPAVIYVAAVGALGVLLALRVPERLSRSD